MDNFKKAQTTQCGVGGMKCSCCNNRARKGKRRGNVDKTFNRIARARIKVETMQEIKGE